MILALSVAGFALMAMLLRTLLLYRNMPQRHRENISARIYRVGSAAIVERESVNPRMTVICMHGFVEDIRYFTHYYADPHIQLILLMSADYHIPVTEPQFHSADWIQTPQHAEATIAYDAEVLTQALENLPKTQQIRVHGHSRGGAVTLEAAAMRPDLFLGVNVILEAPVLPQAYPRRQLSSVMLWLFPFFVPLWRRQPISQTNKRIWGKLDNPRKKAIIMGLPFNAKRAITMLRNLKSMAKWIGRRDYDVYKSLQSGIILIPENDMVLDPVSMQESAERATGHLQVVRVEDCSHFVLFDRPEVIPAFN